MYIDDLEISKYYAKYWTMHGALRELFQNAIDHSNWDYSYNKNNSSLKIIWKDVLADEQCLLGRKLALSALCRLNIPFKLHRGILTSRMKVIEGCSSDILRIISYESMHDVGEDIIITIYNVTK